MAMILSCDYAAVLCFFMLLTVYMHGLIPFFARATRINRCAFRHKDMGARPRFNYAARDLEVASPQKTWFVTPGPHSQGTTINYTMAQKRLRHSKNEVTTATNDRIGSQRCFPNFPIDQKRPGSLS